MVSPTVGNINWTFEKKELKHWCQGRNFWGSRSTFSSTLLGFRNWSKARGFRLTVVAPIPPPLLLRPESTFARFIPQRVFLSHSFLLLQVSRPSTFILLAFCFLAWRYHLPIASPFISLALCQLNWGLIRHFWRLHIGLSAIFLWTFICLL